MRMIEYQVVWNNEFQVFLDLVKSWINVGWQPIGGYFEDKNGNHCQAVVKYEQASPAMSAGAVNLPFNITPSGSIKIVNMTDINSEVEALKEENENLKYQLDGNTALIESLQKENLLLRETSKPRDNALLYEIDLNKTFKKIINDFISYYCRYEGYKWVMLNDDIYTCGTKKHSSDCILNKIIKKYKEDNNENNN